ncbi:hypothetical protein B0H19DRAFT_1071015 [Mycena capillaripes]|nr:hypothetical protein B0H19DRAFT_1071015 [Mycena capillaripes]
MSEHRELGLEHLVGFADWDSERNPISGWCNLGGFYTTVREPLCDSSSGLVEKTSKTLNLGFNFRMLHKKSCKMMAPLPLSTTGRTIGYQGELAAFRALSSPDKSFYVEYANDSSEVARNAEKIMLLNREYLFGYTVELSLFTCCEKKYFGCGGGIPFRTSIHPLDLNISIGTLLSAHVTHFEFEPITAFPPPDNAPTSTFGYVGLRHGDTSTFSYVSLRLATVEPVYLRRVGGAPKLIIDLHNQMTNRKSYIPSANLQPVTTIPN